MTKLELIKQFAQDNDCTIETDAEFSDYYLTSRKTKKVYNWDGFEVKPVATYRFHLEKKGGDISSREVYCLQTRSYKTDGRFKNAIKRLQAELDCAT